MPTEQATLALISDLQATQREISDKMLKATLAMERIAERMESHAERVERLDATVFSSDADSPGLVTRVDRMEQRFLATERVRNYLLGGGLFAFITGAYGVYRLLKDHG